ncbi:MAG: helix-turn-helix domain-containing protein [Candidatus Stygibacter australis]|nr:helix-turn-helix domain-containing protein [Candidatus Stygibacter australis]MDP8322812.1 helix-turn-helix domain-containing protein [Candidatus Stygibacter australis]
MPGKLTKDLVRIGLTEVEANAYLALLDHYKVSARELSLITGIFRTQTYDVLKNLIKKGLCTEVFDKVKTYVPVDPELAFDPIIRDIDEQAKTARNLTRQLHQMFLSNQSIEHSNDKLIEVLRSSSAVHKRLKSYLETTTKVILSFNKPPYQLRLNGDKGDLLACSPHDSSKIVHKSIFQIDSTNPRHSLEVAQKFQALGETVKLARFLPMKMMIFDNTRVFYLLTADNSISESDTATFIRHPEITLTLINSFWVEWQRSITLDEFQQELDNEKLNPSSKAKSVP